MKFTAISIAILISAFCFLPFFVGKARADFVPFQSSYSQEVVLPLGETSVEKLYRTNNASVSGRTNCQVAVNEGKIVTKKVSKVYSSSSYQAKPIKTTHPYNATYSTNQYYTRKACSPFSNNAYTVQKVDFPSQSFNFSTTAAVMPIATATKILAPFSNTTTPVLYALSDNDDDDDWNPGGTGGFDNPGDVGQAPLTDAIFFLCLLALLYAVSKYFHTNNQPQKNKDYEKNNI